MPKRDQLRRLLEIDRRVRADEYPHPKQLAVELEVAQRVIFNDRSYLINVLGAPLEFHTKRRGWYYTEPTWILPTALVTRSQLLAFFLAVEAAQRQLGPALESELLSAVEKIGQSLPGSVAVNLETLRSHLSFAVPPSALVKPEYFAELCQAIESQKVVEMSYFSAHRGQLSQREVEPHHLNNDGGDWYLMAYDRSKEQMLTFNVARIKSLRLLTQGFARQSNFSPEEFVKSGFRADSGPQQYEVVIQFDATQAPYIFERHFHATESKEIQSDGSLMLRFQSSGLRGLVRWLLQYGPRATVLSPPELRSALRDEVSAMAQKFVREDAGQN